MIDAMWGWAGLIGGPAIGLLCWWGARRAGVRQRMLDERYVLHWQKARAAAWFCTLCTVMLFFVLYSLGMPLTVPAALGGVLLVHLFSWGAVGTYYAARG
ncbi:hypothetical protein ACVNS2_14635 [Paenibacillus caseinilyticus]|uniref:DUF2178 domain-containing protein n=1 Tax=Paenibacillus mucilaginosus K02 TaxID=997761 RepID=I0BHM9_9BACL|nr:hypothetical protein [Paenibacillus mucilaginosus]AFH61876.1 hypothetical protein B2K_14320 [Paenibacillus mucilaginosus K02]